MNQTEFGREDVEILQDETVWQDFFKVRKLRLRHRLFAGGWSPELSRELFNRHDAVGVLLYDPQLDAVAFVEQMRVGALERESSPWLLELVAGLIDKDEAATDVAIRESQEEAGVVVEELEYIADYFSSPGGSSEYFHLYCANADLSEAGGIHGLVDEGEDIRVHVVPVAELDGLMAAGRLNNAHALIAVLWFKQNRDELRGRWVLHD